MADLDSLLALPGAMAAFEATGSGELLDHRGDEKYGLSAEILGMVAQMCAANMSIAKMQALGWEKMSDLHGFDPVNQFTLIGFDCSVTVGTHGDHLVGVVARNDMQDLDALSKAISGA